MTAVWARTLPMFRVERKTGDELAQDEDEDEQAEGRTEAQHDRELRRRPW